MGLHHCLRLLEVLRCFRVVLSCPAVLCLCCGQDFFRCFLSAGSCCQLPDVVRGSVPPSFVLDALQLGLGFLGFLEVLDALACVVVPGLCALPCLSPSLQDFLDCPRVFLLVFPQSLVQDPHPIGNRLVRWARSTVPLASVRVVVVEEDECPASARVWHAVPDSCSRSLPLGAAVLPEPEVLLARVEVLRRRAHSASVLVLLPSGELRHDVRLVGFHSLVERREPPFGLRCFHVPWGKEPLLPCG
eukprot:5400113-Heterocapsa_arctica.AAC.1